MRDRSGVCRTETERKGDGDMGSLSQIYTVGGLMMVLFLSACAAAEHNASEGPLPSVATQPVAVMDVDYDGDDVVAS